MGLTIHYHLNAPPGTDAAQALEFVQAMRRRAQGFAQRGRVGRVLPIRTDEQLLRWARQWRSVPHPHRRDLKSEVEITPEAGWLFETDVGEDCEPLRLGLCRYPRTVALAGRRHRTHLPGWRYAGFAKTQYASLHGWAHFRRCHTAVAELVAGLRRLGLDVSISDEGDYWPGRRLDLLRQNLDEMNGAVAAAAGALRDMDPDGAVESPIFRHPHFERVEAAGAEQAGEPLRRALATMTRQPA